MMATELHWKQIPTCSSILVAYFSSVSLIRFFLQMSMSAKLVLTTVSNAVSMK